MLNCKQGDLAMIVRGCEKHLGYIYLILSSAGIGPCLDNHGNVRIAQRWNIDGTFTTASGFKGSILADDMLRPIRPDALDSEESEEYEWVQHA